MAYGDNTAIWGTSGARIRRGLTDPVGGSATYSAWVDFPGIASLQASANMITDDAKGNDTIVATAARLLAWDLKFSAGLESIEALEVLMGGATTYNGTTPNQTASHTYPTGSRPGWFEITVQSSEEDGTDGAGMTRTFHKCHITKLESGNQTEKFSQPSFEARAIRRKSDGALHTFLSEETQSALPTAGSAADTTPPTVSSSTPADAATGVLVGATVSFVFSEDLNLASATDTGSYFLFAAAAGTAVPFTVAYTVATKTAVLTPTSALTASTTAYVAGCTTAIRDLAGNRLAGQYVVNFVTAA